MHRQCAKHVFEAAETTCGTCGLEFCSECLVYAFGPKKAPLCIPCAVTAAGIRASAGSRSSPARRRLSPFQRLRAGKARPATPSPELLPDLHFSPGT